VLHLLWFRQGLPGLTPQTLRHSLVRTAWLLALMAGLHVAAMMVFEGLGPGDALWLTATTLTTVGYGDVSASTLPGRISTVLLLYAAGIFLLANLATFWVDYRSERRQQMVRGRWRWNMKNHIVIMNAPSRGAATYFLRLVQQIREWDAFRDTPIQLLTEAFPEELPDGLPQLGVVHYHGNPDDPEALDMVNIEAASHVIVLAESEHEPRADTITLGLLERLASRNVQAQVVVECVDDRNRPRFARFFPQATLLRPVRSYPEILTRALAAPGTEKVLEDLFQYEGVHPRRYDVDLRGMRWLDVVTRLLGGGSGLPIAYVRADGGVVSSPPPDEAVEAVALIIMVDAARSPSHADLQALVQDAEAGT
jgi:voltage-gated potassium channel